MRQAHRPQAQPLITLEEARRRKPVLDWSDVRQPESPGVKTCECVPLAEIVPYIDWSPFFAAWELRGTYPKIFDDATVGVRARELFDDAPGTARQAKIVAQKLVTARAVMGIYPAASVGDDVEVYSDESRSDRLMAFHFLRQQMEKAPGHYNYSLADFIAPKDSGVRDYLGGFAVSAGFCLESLVARFERDHDDYNSIMAKALADRLAEALAELMHKRARAAWGYGKHEQLSSEDMLHERYRGIRPALRLPRLSRPYREAAPVGLARRRATHRHQTDGKLRHVSGGFGEWFLLRAS